MKIFLVTDMRTPRAVIVADSKGEAKRLFFGENTPNRHRKPGLKFNEINPSKKQASRIIMEYP